MPVRFVCAIKVWILGVWFGCFVERFGIANSVKCSDHDALTYTK